MPKKLTQEEFIERSKVVHGEDKYDYSLVEYQNNITKVEITCSIHGRFSQYPVNHIRGVGCPKCGIIKRAESQASTVDDFISKVRLLFGDKYDYQKVRYKNNRTHVTVICRLHGQFPITPANHLKGRGCPKCGAIMRSENQAIKTDEFILRASLIHKGKYDYSKSIYSRSNTSVSIICPEHGEFFQVATIHLKGHGCPKCQYSAIADKKRTRLEDFIKMAVSIHNGFYSYDLVEYKNNRTPVAITCQRHGLFYQRPSHHLNGRGCPICRQSQGERIIALFLENHGISYQRQVTFNKCRYKKMLPFDFYFRLNELRYLIEFDGEFHYRIAEQWGGQKQLVETKKKDTIKTKFAQDNGFILIRIPYTEKHIEWFLQNEIENYLPSPLPGK